MPLSFPGIGNSAEFVGQAVSLRRTQRWKGTQSTRLPTSVQKPAKRVDNPPQVANLPHRSILRVSIDACCPIAGKLSGIAHECCATASGIPNRGIGG